ncbi:PhoX family protein [Thermoleptolyngbya sichuanensis]|uniref:PhoX family protein n=1 Tax=Thermoleptolyngbya sichuanensis TaxID=2885951 RepID=UPI00352962D3
MSLKRRHFLMFMGASAGSLALQPLVQNGQKLSPALEGTPASAQTATLPFTPVKGPMPVETDGVSLTNQISQYSTFAVKDDMVLPPGYTYDIIASWGDKVGEKDHFGYNNDYLSLIETAPNEGFLIVNHEYISAKPWAQTYKQVIGVDLPFADVKAAAMAAPDGKIDASSLPSNDPLRQKIYAISKAAQYDAGVSIISVRKNANGVWERTYSRADRRITGISGLEDGRYLKATGPATVIFKKTSGQGFIDGLGNKIIGTHQNCSGGTTPWGTAFVSEENFQGEVPEPVYADGTSFPHSNTPFQWVTAESEVEDIAGQGNVLGYQGNKYGWLVEIDPANPNDFGTKHTWLGRYRHEGFGIRAEAGKKLCVYSGCDRRSGHIYKFVSAGTVRDPKSKANSRLLEDGMLYAAKFNPDGTGSWIALKADTPVNPDLPSAHVGGMITLPKRPEGGVVRVTDDAAIATFKSQFRTLGDLYTGNAAEKQGAILIDAHFAANAAGATCTARPEDTDIAPDGSLFIAFTSGSSSSSDGSPHKEVFKAPTGESHWEYGWIMKLVETNNDPAAMTFRWEMLALGGEPADGGLGFANPDNLEIDAKGNIWMVTDMSTDKHNIEVSSRIKSDGSKVSQSNLRGLYGNNSIWYIPTSGPNAGEAFMFGYGPMDCETTGPFLSKDQTTLFLSVQHPGEYSGVRENMKSEVRKFAMRTTDGKEFMQEREVPIGSNWPGKRPNDPPKPSVIAVRRINGAPLV